VKSTKTYETRDVELAPDLLAELRCHLAWLTRHALAQGWGDPAWLFPGADSTRLDETRVRRTFRRALKRAGARAFTCYELRHTFTGLLLSLGAGLLYVSRQFGHKNRALRVPMRNQKCPILRVVGRQGLEPWTR
jgi:integrase